PAAATRPPFAYCICPADAAGFYAFRPSVFFSSDPRMKKYADEANRTIAAAMKMIGGPESFPKVEEIEQISGGLFVKVNEKAPKRQRGMLVGSLLTLRTVGDYDWKSAVEGIAK